jgi:hypothetical protein
MSEMTANNLVIRRMVDKRQSYTAIFLKGEELSLIHI